MINHSAAWTRRYTRERLRELRAALGWQLRTAGSGDVSESFQRLQSIFREAPLGCTRPHLGHISATPRLYLGYTSAIPRPIFREAPLGNVAPIQISEEEIARMSEGASVFSL